MLEAREGKTVSIRTGLLGLVEKTKYHTLIDKGFLEANPLWLGSIQPSSIAFHAI